MHFVDTNIILDIATRDSVWFEWSRTALETAAMHGPITTNLIVVAELYSRKENAATIERLLLGLQIEIAELSEPMARRAGAAHSVYRENRGQNQHILADFLIGAHASIERIPLITRDARRFRTYFPEIDLITPEMPE